MNLKMVFLLLFLSWSYGNEIMAAEPKITYEDLEKQCSVNPPGIDVNDPNYDYGYKEADQRGLGDQCAFTIYRGGKDCLRRLEENFRNEHSQSEPHGCKFGRMESCMKLENIRRSNVDEEPMAALVFRLCVAGFGGNRTAILKVFGGCASLHARRFCLRPGVRGVFHSKSTDNKIQDFINRNKVPPIRICPYFDTRDAGDSDFYYQPAHMMTDKNDLTDSENAALGATYGSFTTAAPYLTVIATGGAMLAAPFIAIGAALGAFISFMEGHLNHVVWSNWNACTSLPVNPYPPAYYFNIPPIDPPVVFRRHCGVNEKISIHEPCIKKSPPSDHAKTYVEVGHSSKIPLCGSGDDENFVCVDIKNWGTNLSTPPSFLPAVPNYVIPNCKNSPNNPCFEVTQGEEVKTEINHGRLLFVKKDDKIDDKFKRVNIYNGDDKLEIYGIEPTQVNGINLFKEMSYIYSNNADSSSADGGTKMIKPLFKYYVVNSGSLEDLYVRQFELRPNRSNDEQIILYRGPVGAQVSNPNYKIVGAVNRLPLTEKPSVSKCDPCSTESTHNEPRLKFKIHGATREIGIKDGISEETYAFGYKFTVSPTDLDYIQNLGATYYRQDGILMSEVIGKYDVPPDSGDDDDDSVQLELDNVNSQYDYIEGFEANSGRYLRGGDKLCLTGYKSQESFWVRNLKLLSSEFSNGYIIPSPFREHVHTYKYSKSDMWKYLSGKDVLTINDPDKDPTSDDPDKYAIRSKTPAELGLCVDIPTIKGDCEEIDGNLKPNENGYASWKKTELNKIVKGECIDGYEEDGQAPERRCIKGYEKPVFGIIKFPCKAIPEE